MNIVNSDQNEYIGMGSMEIETCRHDKNTRTSFEVHPSLIIEDMMDEILFDDDEISNEIDFSCFEKGDVAKMDLLAELLRI